mgnify:CR=1 FL=1
MAQKNNFDPIAISKLVLKLINGELTVSEQASLDEWLSADPANSILLEKLLDRSLWEKEVPQMNSFDTENALKEVLQRLHTEGKSEGRRRWFSLPLWRFVAAAAVILVVFTIVFKRFNTKQAIAENLNAKSRNVTEQNDKVMLTLSDGRQVDIASLSNGSLKQGQATVSKDGDGLTYQVDAANQEASSNTAYNTLTVPMGKQYQLTLPDGTEVWLNSQSSLTYPVAFNTNERLVELSGEGYFEVAHIAKQPFKVKSGNQIVKVLGTHFNIEAYPEDQRTVTTLVEGSVSVEKENSSIKIKPGQMAINLPSAKLRSESANVTDVLAWKNGMFSFNDDRIEDIMRKVARSYNMEVEYQGDVKDKRFWGVFPRNKGLSSLLKNLEQTNTIHFKVTGRRIIVMP